MRWITTTAFASFAILPSLAAFATPPVYVPFPCDTSYKVTQAHGGFSHNDAINRWAWDFGIPVGGEVVAPADGIVRAVRMSSTRGGCDSAYISDANYIVIDFLDGTDANFTHLQANSTNLKVGSPVKRGDVVGKVGLSGWVCGAHLHFQFQNTCSTPACNSIQTDFVDFGDPDAGTVIKSNNCAPPPCDLVLDSSAPLVIDEKYESCFERITSYFWPVLEGDEGHHYYTFTATVPDAETIGRWQFNVAEPGTYEVEVFIPDTEVTSTRAVYTIESGGNSVTSEPFDQAANRGWHSLGVFDFAPGPSTIALTDNTGEDAAKLAFDTVRLTWTPPPPEPAPQPQPEPGADIGVSDPEPGAVTEEDASAVPAEEEGSQEGDAGQGAMVIRSEGAACSTAAASPTTTLLAFLLLAVARIRRRS